MEEPREYEKRKKLRKQELMINIKRTNSDDPDFHRLVRKLDKDLLERYGELQVFYNQYNKIENLETVVVAYEGEKPVGCGCFKRF